jgi:hypothetical protein
MSANIHDRFAQPQKTLDKREFVSLKCSASEGFSEVVISG